MSSKDVYETSGNRSKNLKCLKLYIMVPCFLKPKLVHIRCEHWDAKKKILLKLKERGDAVARVQKDGHIKTDYHYQVKEDIRFYNEYLLIYLKLNCKFLLIVLVQNL